MPTRAERIAAFRKVMFSKVDELQASGKVVPPKRKHTRNHSFRWRLRSSAAVRRRRGVSRWNLQEAWGARAFACPFRQNLPTDNAALSVADCRRGGGPALADQTPRPKKAGKAGKAGLFLQPHASAVNPGTLGRSLRSGPRVYKNHTQSGSPPTPCGTADAFYTGNEPNFGITQRSPHPDH